uniref:Uncharacterized protein n=1 Tax=Chromera velia CCMP2878 TaxID=1169474 RepID=A0A0G4H859_9ALVE|eukprot:Cvel_25100.t1-p1 / transcript=Cvel_25100.t1 / gene=Cvel_25100 / organism=Chromera_velia_CCMP2878 / gene_product=hypothetical protein / transcript_product=hypothetical protein / location=Cvel_scaffold2799:19343-22540(-) / protein_length=688 / sequence_SO=supercontig / SO=protein_coding / is_pseudo=false
MWSPAYHCYGCCIVSEHFVDCLLSVIRYLGVVHFSSLLLLCFVRENSIDPVRVPTEGLWPLNKAAPFLNAHAAVCVTIVEGCALSGILTVVLTRRMEWWLYLLTNVLIERRVRWAGEKLFNLPETANEESVRAILAGFLGKQFNFFVFFVLLFVRLVVYFLTVTGRVLKVAVFVLVLFFWLVPFAIEAHTADILSSLSQHSWFLAWLAGSLVFWWYGTQEIWSVRCSTCPSMQWWQIRTLPSVVDWNFSVSELENRLLTVWGLGQERMRAGLLLADLAPDGDGGRGAGTGEGTPLLDGAAGVGGGNERRKGVISGVGRVAFWVAHPLAVHVDVFFWCCFPLILLLAWEFSPSLFTSWKDALVRAGFSEMFPEACRGWAHECTDVLVMILVAIFFVVYGHLCGGTADELGYAISKQIRSVDRIDHIWSDLVLDTKIDVLSRLPPVGLRDAITGHAPMRPEVLSLPVTIDREEVQSMVTELFAVKRERILEREKQKLEKAKRRWPRSVLKYCAIWVYGLSVHLLLLHPLFYEDATKVFGLTGKSSSCARSLCQVFFFASLGHLSLFCLVNPLIYWALASFSEEDLKEAVGEGMPPAGLQEAVESLDQVSVETWKALTMLCTEGSMQRGGDFWREVSYREFRELFGDGSTAVPRSLSGDGVAGTPESASMESRSETGEGVDVEMAVFGDRE